MYDYWLKIEIHLLCNPSLVLQWNKKETFNLNKKQKEKLQ
jgi:hypothetical protein